MRLVSDNATNTPKKPSLSTELERLKARVDSERLRVEPQVRESVSISLWGFAALRNKASEALAEAVPFLREGMPLPHDVNVRLCKTLLASCLLDKMEQLRNAVMADPTMAKVELFKLTTSEVGRLLSRGYFSKSLPRIKREYFRAEPALLACAECCSVPFEPSESAMRKQADKAEMLMDEF